MNSKNPDDSFRVLGFGEDAPNNGEDEATLSAHPYNIFKDNPFSKMIGDIGMALNPLGGNLNTITGEIYITEKDRFDAAWGSTMSAVEAILTGWASACWSNCFCCNEDGC